MKFDEKELNQKLKLVTEGMAHDLVNEFKEAAPKDTGFLMRNIRYQLTEEGIEFSFPYYAEYLEYGTGIYGPKGQPITPKNAKALHWKTKDKKDVFAMKVAGMTPRPFIRPVFHQKFTEILVKNLNEHMQDIKINL